MLVLYTILFFAVWTAGEWLVKPQLASAVPNEAYAQLLISGLIKNLVWTLPALIVNALLFLAIHFPKWIASGEFVFVFTSFGFAEVIALSLLFGVSFLSTRNLLLPIALHSFYDLAVIMLI